MSYENAPQTRMLATDCAVCGRPLCDAKSVEIGIGPECRKQTGYSAIHECTEEVRQEANKLVYQIAVVQTGAGIVEPCARLFELGFTKLVVAIMKRRATVKITETDDTCPFGPGLLAVKTPYSEDAVQAMHRVPGRRWWKDGKVNVFPKASRGMLYGMLQNLYCGHAAIGPKGPFVIGPRE